jgi:hypothetical protein
MITTTPIITTIEAMMIPAIPPFVKTVFPEIILSFVVIFFTGETASIENL